MVVLTPKCVYAFFFFFAPSEASARFVSEQTMFSRQNTDDFAGKKACVCDCLTQMKLFQYLIIHNENFGNYWKQLCNVILIQF